MNRFHNHRHCSNGSLNIAVALVLAFTATSNSMAQERTEPADKEASNYDATSGTLVEVARKVEKLETVFVAAKQLEDASTSDMRTPIFVPTSMVKEIDKLRESVRQIMRKKAEATAANMLSFATGDEAPERIGYCPVLPPTQDNDPQFTFVATTLLRRIDQLADAVEQKDEKPAERDEKAIAELWDQIDRIDDGLSKIEAQVRHDETRIATMNTLIATYEELAGTGVRIAFDFDGLYNAFDELMLDLGTMADDNRRFVSDAFKVYQATIDGGEFKQSATARGLVGRAGQNQTNINHALGKLGALFDRIRAVESSMDPANQ